MQAINPVETLHNALSHAIYVGFPEIEYTDRDWEHYRKTKEDVRIAKKRQHSSYDVTVTSMFPQTWSSTALGFGGIGGQAFTQAYVVVVESNQGHGYAVYFGGRFAYKILRPTEKFFEDIVHSKMHDVAGAHARYEKSVS